jgi:hypothetical protein
VHQAIPSSSSSTLLAPQSDDVSSTRRLSQSRQDTMSQNTKATFTSREVNQS